MNLLKKTAGDLQYILLWLTIRVIRALPYRTAISIGRSLGTLAWICVPLHRWIARTQIRYALAEEADERLMTRKMFMHQGEIVIDAIKYAYMDDDLIREKVVVEGQEYLEAAIASGRGILGIAGHTNWEIMA